MLKIVLALSLALSPLAYASNEVELTAFFANPVALPADLPTLQAEADRVAAHLLEDSVNLDRALEKVVTTLNVFHRADPEAVPFLQLELLSLAIAKQVIKAKPLNPASMTRLAEFLNTRYATDEERQAAADALADRLFNNPALRELNAAFNGLKSRNAKTKAAAEERWQAADQIAQVATIPQLLAPGETASENTACLIKTIDGYGKPTVKERGCAAAAVNSAKWSIGFGLAWGAGASAMAGFSVMAGFFDADHVELIGNFVGYGLPAGLIGGALAGAGRILTGAHDRARTAGLKNVLLAQLIVAKKKCDELLK